MSGVFGFIEPACRVPAGELGTQMAAKMSHRDWYISETWEDREHNLVLGRIGIGIFNRTPQPVWNASHTLALMMAGELYSPRPANTQTDEQAVLSLFETYRNDFVHQLNGAFIIAIWDAARQELILANDRFGMYPLYYTHRAGHFIFAPEVKGVLCDQTVPRQLDMTALAQIMRFQHLFGERTFFEDVKQLPPACVLVYSLPTKTCQLTTYWIWADIPYRPQVNFAEAVEETSRLLSTSVRRLSGDNYRPGVYLSGGLDSRTILGMVEHRPVASLTYGMRDCRDVHIAARIAEAVKSDHHWVDFPDGNWVKEYADFHLTLTEGFHSWIHSHGISTLSLGRQVMDVNLSGWDGGTVMGHPDSIEPRQCTPVDDMALTTRLFGLFNQSFTWPSITEAEEALLYTPAMATKMRGLAFDSFQAELQPFLRFRPDVRSEYFYIHHHCRRMTQNMLTFTRSHIEERFPFFDYALIDFLYSLPATLRADRNLYRAVIQKSTPTLAYIPYDHDELLPTTHKLRWASHALVTKAKRRINQHIRPTFHDRFTLYADYENYLRHELREWAEGILFDTRTVEHGIFQPSFLSSLMKRHLSGYEEWTIGKIAPIITYELMLRKFYDEG